MNLVPQPELAPAICVICEGAHHPSDPAWVDTLRNFDVGVQTYLTGRKFVCGACAARIAMAVGFIAPEEHQALAEEVNSLVDALDKLESRAKDMDDLRSILARAQADLLAEEYAE